MNLRCLLLGSVIAFLIVGNNADVEQNEKDVSNLLKDIEIILPLLLKEEAVANLQNEISLPKDLKKTQIAKKRISQFLRSISADVINYKRVQLKNPELKRQLDLIPLGYEVLSEEQFEHIAALSTYINNIFKNIKLCSYKDQNRCNLTFVPEVRTIAFKSEDPEEVKFYWLEWRRKASAAVRDNFKKFVELYRTAANMNGFSKPSDFWHKDIGESSSSVLQYITNFVLQLRPMFEQAHAYIRGNMRLKYGSEVIEYNKPIPQHLYLPFLQKAFIWGHNVKLPYSTSELCNITDKLMKKGATAHDNFITANDFLKSLGMPQLEKSFWPESSKPKADLKSFDQTHKAWKFYGLHHANFSYSPLIQESTFFNMFEIVSDIHYYRAYENLITLYQKEPVPKVNSALGKFFSLAASSPKYLEGLEMAYPNYKTKEARINRLYATGLRLLFSTPLHYALERYRLSVIDETINIDDNCAYWQLSEDLYGVQPPVSRSKTDFDAAGVLRIKLDDEHTSFLYSTVLQYQLFEHFCTLTGEYVKGDPEKPLDLCDLSGHQVVGEKVYQAMSKGSSVDLKEFLKLLVDSEELNINGVLEYYKPLFEWLIEENQRRNNEVGWEKANKCL